MRRRTWSQVSSLLSLVFDLSTVSETEDRRPWTEDRGPKTVDRDLRRLRDVQHRPVLDDAMFSLILLADEFECVVERGDDRFQRHL